MAARRVSLAKMTCTEKNLEAAKKGPAKAGPQPEVAWYSIENVPEIDSPALLVYPDRVVENIRRMIAMAGNVGRLRPHMKTHKLPEVIKLQLAQGITKFKCATIAEAEMTANCGAKDVMLAHQPIGPKVKRFIELINRFPNTNFSTIADSPEVLQSLSAAALAAKTTLEVLIDVDCGMHRTGIEPSGAAELYRMLCSLPGLVPGGLHAYDGHIRSKDPTERANACKAAFIPVRALRDDLIGAGLPVPRVVAGGTPTFPIHARHPDVECSPGTLVFWDAGYGTNCPDMDFLNAALVLTRVVSKPGGNRLCLDLGHKAIASENPHPRVLFLNLPDAKAISHSEEHLVVETESADEIELGKCIYGVPWHVCPTVALHAEAVVVRSGHAQDRWEVTARRRRLSV
jgi:D-serine deaminase-like pyridoxal phosphate-dependent protein